ncbi:MAG: DUF4837 family protein [Bacteroidia bacterium]|nr:MAG: DUF4837 family protein [Bacteroidia bacterium]
MIKSTSLLILILILTIQSCSDSGDSRTSFLPNVGGSSGEVVVVIDKVKWDGEAGKKLREILEAPIPELPQAEPVFDLVNVSPGGFGDLYITHRNVVIVETGPGKKAIVTYNLNVYAKSQLVITIEGETDDDIIELLKTQGQKIIDKINITERDRLISYYKGSLNSVNFTTLLNTHKLILWVPSNYALDVNEKGFVWLSYETPLTTQSILVHYFDYNGENYFNEDSIRTILNNMTRTKVKGPVDGSWMTIEERLPVNYSTFRFRDRNYAMLKGLWTLENGFMGGPFVTLVTKDEVNNRFVMLDGFVYAPNDDKRELLRQVESILFTAGFDIQQ